MTENQWKTFFDLYAPRYKDEVFVQNTEFEINFIHEELAVPPGGTILEIGCGTGRHSVGLAKRGYCMTSLDISDGMLAIARRSAEEAGVSIEFVREDVMDFTPRSGYDGAICLCEGALCLLGEGDDPYTRDEAILRKVCGALKPGGKFIVNALNVGRLMRLHTDEDVTSGRFDLVTSTENYSMEVETHNGKLTVPVRERVYSASEFVGVMLRAGFVVDHVWGGTAGSWNRQPLNLDEYEIMVVAHAP